MRRPFTERRGGSHITVPSLAGGGGGASPPVEDTPATIMGANCVEWWRADLGVTVVTGVSSWIGQVLGTEFAQATGANQPAYDATGGPNSTAIITGDGVNDFLSCTLARAAPATTPAVIWLIMRQVTWAANDAICNDAAGAFALLQRTASPQIAMSNVTIVNNHSGLPVATWGRLQAYFSGSTSDEIFAIAAAPTTGASAGNTAGTGPRLFTNSGGTTFGNIALAEVALFDAKPDAGQKTSLDAYVTTRYGAGLV